MRRTKFPRERPDWGARFARIPAILAEIIAYALFAAMVADVVGRWVG